MLVNFAYSNSILVLFFGIYVVFILILVNENDTISLLRIIILILNVQHCRQTMSMTCYFCIALCYKSQLLSDCHCVTLKVLFDIQLV